MTKKTYTSPNWYKETAPDDSYRSLFKWGSLSEFKHPNKGLVEHMKKTFGLTDADFRERRRDGLEKVDFEVPLNLGQEQISFFETLLGKENIKSDTYSRLKASYGKSMLDALRLRDKIIKNIPDLVLCPRDKQDVQKILEYCHIQHIPLYVYGAGSSVTRGMEAVKGGVTLDLSTHMNRVLAFNEQDQTICVEAGMWGPKLEDILQNAVSKLDAKRDYTCGHFPQSFEYSSVGGWVVTRGAGQNSTYYGKIEDIVIAQEYVTPRGTVKTRVYPRQATGPDLDQIFMGSEGTFGVLVNATLKLRRYMPENRTYFSYMFKTWEEGLAAVQEIMQAEGGYPSVLRLSDPEETDIALKLYGIEDTPASGLLTAMGYQPMQRCLMLGLADGEKGYCRNVKKTIARIARRYSVFPLSLVGVTQRWEHGRFRDPYLREDLHDFGIMLDTLECSMTWSQLPEVYAKVRGYIKSHPDMICMTHCSHFYPQGTNLYFIFITKMEKTEEYLKLLYGILETIKESGATMSHHHGMGKQTAPWLEEQLGSREFEVLKCLKDHFDPHNILNPGGTLGFDLSTEQKNKTWGLQPETNKTDLS